MTVKIRTAAKHVALAGKIVIDLTIVAAGRAIERIFRFYDEIAPAGAGGMTE
jgi:hypothetical protein